MDISIFDDFEWITSGLTHAEIGKLTLAVLAYAKTGQTYDMDGNERIIFPIIKQKVDTLMEKERKLSEIRSASGKLGGRPKQGSESEEKQKKQMLSTESKKSKCFLPPTPEEVRAYCTEHNLLVDAEQFCDFYASKGWMVGKNKMQSWHKAASGWSNRQKEREQRRRRSRESDNIFLELVRSGELED